MHYRSLTAIFLTAAVALSTGALAQPVYKCGERYSQTPCPGGALIDTSDPRSAAQKAQTDLATVRDARSADAMEQARLQQEQADLAANTPKAKPPSADRASNSRVGQVKKKEKAPDSFTVRSVVEKKKKPTHKKNPVKKRPVKKDAGKS